MAHGLQIADVLTAVTLSPSLSFPKVTTTYPSMDQARQWLCCPYRMASQRTSSHAPGGKTPSLLATLCMLIVRYSNNMELYSAKVNKISCHHPLRRPLLHVGRYEYTRVVIPDNILQLVLISLFFSNIFG